MLQDAMERNAINPGDVLGVILAGGAGRRMGGVDKALVLLGGRPLAAHVAARLAPQLEAGRLMLNSNGESGQFAGLGLPLLPDGMAARPGPLAGLLAAMRAAEASGAGWVLSAPVDTPFLPSGLVARLAAASRGGAITLAASAGGLCQVCGLWPVELAGPLAESIDSGQNKVMDFVERHPWARVEFPPEVHAGRMIDPFHNLNTPADLALAEDFIGGGA